VTTGAGKAGKAVLFR